MISKPWYSLILFLLCCAFGGAQQPLTNDSVVKMGRAGLSEDVIVSMIKTQAAQYTVTPEQLIALKSAGVPDRVISAMVERNAGANAGAGAYYAGGAASGATPAAGNVAAGDPNDPMAPHDSGIYLYAKDRNGEYKMTALEQASYQGSKMGGMLGAAFTYGLKKAKNKAVIPGQHASIRTPDRQPVFYFYFEDKAAGLGKAAFGASVSNPNQFALIKLEVTKSSRETVIGEYGVSGISTGTDQKAMVSFKSERLRAGLYKVSPDGPMAPGEYCFLGSPVNMGAYAAGAAGIAQIFDFAVSPGE